MKHCWHALRHVGACASPVAEAEGKTAMLHRLHRRRAGGTLLRHPDEDAGSAVQTFGGRGVRSGEVEIRALHLHEGATKAQKLIIERDVLKAA
jgi:hypothetical protein